MNRDRPRSSSEPDRGWHRSAPDPLGRAMLAHHRGEPGRLVYRDGAAVENGNVADFYFSSSDTWEAETITALERVAGHDPVLDVGCGAGKHLLWFADRDVDAVGIDVSPNAIRTARARGLDSGRLIVGDMFELPFRDGAFGAVHAVGTQLGLGRSLAGIRALLAAFARVTHEDGIAVVDSYDPTRLEGDLLGYRSDPREGVAHRCFHLEFERETSERIVGQTLQFLLCSPDRLREATEGTPWQIADVLRADSSVHYRAVLER